MPRYLTVFFFIVSHTLLSQQSALTSDLSRLSEATGATFSYDADLLRDVSLDERPKTIADLDAFFRAHSALKLVSLGGREYLILPQKREVMLRFRSAVDSVSLQPSYVDIVRPSLEVLYQGFLDGPDASVRFQWLPKPNDTLRIMSTAHNPVNVLGSELLVRLEKEIPLQEKITYLNEVVVENYLTKGISLNVPRQTTSLKMKDLALIPGETDGDILAALATLPGINTPDSRAGNLYIRGSAPDQNLLMYDNIPIYHRGHFFGTISPFHPAAVASVEVFKNGLDPSMGGRVGGAVAIQSSNHLAEFDSIGVGINSLYGTAFLSKKIGEKVGLTLASRRSLPSDFRPPKLVNISEVVYAATALTGPNNDFSLDDVDVIYTDHNLNLLIAPNDRNKLKVSSLFTRNDITYVFAEDSALISEKIVFDNYGLSGSWDHVFDEGWKGTLVGFGSRYKTTYTQREEAIQDQRVNFDVGQTNEIQDYAVAYKLSGRLSDRSRLTGGIGLQHTAVSFDYRDVPVNRTPIRVGDKTNATLTSGFANYEYKGLGGADLQVGARADYFSNMKKVFFSPRALLNVDVGERGILKASVSRNYQFLNQIKLLQFGNSGFDNELWRLAGDENIKPIHCNQGMIGFLYNQRAWVVDLEVYGRHVKDVNYATTTDLRPSTGYEPATWKIGGVDLFSKIQVTNGLSLWGGYEYAYHHIVLDANKSTAYPFRYHRPHRVKLGGLWQHKRWKYSFSWKILSGVSGRSISAINEFAYVEERSGEIPSPGGMPGRPPQDILTIDDLPERYPMFRSLDFFVTYRLPATPKRKWKAVFGLSLINVFDNQNLIDQVVRGNNAMNRRLLDRNALGFSPNLSITVFW